MGSIPTLATNMVSVAGAIGFMVTLVTQSDEELYREAVVKLLDSYSQLTAAQIELVKQLAG